MTKGHLKKCFAIDYPWGKIYQWITLLYRTSNSRTRQHSEGYESKLFSELFIFWWSCREIMGSGETQLFTRRCRGLLRSIPPSRWYLTAYLTWIFLFDLVVWSAWVCDWKGKMIYLKGRAFIAQTGHFVL